MSLWRAIPGHMPDWRNPRSGDPGRTLIDLFGWLGETLLYRVNLIPARQRLEFLRLLNIPLRPARPARGLVTLSPASPRGAAPTPVPIGTQVTGPVPFETTGPILVQPFEGRVLIKRRPSAAERGRLAEVIAGLEFDLRHHGERALCRDRAVRRRQGGAGGRRSTRRQRRPHDLDRAARDGANPPDIATARQALETQPAMLNIGVVPRLILPDPDPNAPTVAPPDLFEWSITGKRRVGNVEQDTYLALPVEQDSTVLFTREGTLRLVLPHRDVVGFPANDVAPTSRPASATARHDSMIRTRPRAWSPGCGCTRAAATARCRYHGSASMRSRSISFGR